MILNEQGIWYERKSVLDDPNKKKPFTFHKIRYLWLYLPLGKSGVDEVGCRTMTDFDRLIQHWNRSLRWLYCPSKWELILAAQSNLEELPLISLRYPNNLEVQQIIERRLRYENSHC